MIRAIGEYLVEKYGGGVLTTADIQMSFPLIAASARGGLTSSRPNLWRWFMAIQLRPAFQRANERGGVLKLA